MVNATTQEIIDHVCEHGRYNTTSNPAYQYFVRWNGKAVFARDTNILVKKIKEIEGIPQ